MIQFAVAQPNEVMLRNWFRRLEREGQDMIGMRCSQQSRWRLPYPVGWSIT